MTIFSQEVQTFRNRMGCGLREAFDAVTKYGSAEKAMEALRPDLSAEKQDPYARAVADRERWHQKSSTYRAALQRIQNHPHFALLTDAFQVLVKEGLNDGDAL